MRSVVALTLVLSFVSLVSLAGCAMTSTDHSPLDMSDAASVSMEELPSVVRDGFAREHRGNGIHEGAVGVKIEYSKKRNVYRFTLPDGTMIHLNANGEWAGTVI